MRLLCSVIERTWPTVLTALLLQTAAQAMIDCRAYLSEDDCHILDDIPGPMAWAAPVDQQFRHEVRQLPNHGVIVRGGDPATLGFGSGSAPYVSVLAPPTPGATINPQPRLYWFLSRDVPTPVRIKLFRGFSGEKEVVLNGAHAGIHTFDLAEQGITLAPNEVYELSVTVDDETETVSRGSVVLVASPTVNLPGASAVERAVWSIENWLWYDTLAALEEAVGEDPNWRGFRARLFQEAGLERAAAYDLRQVR